MFLSSVAPALRTARPPMQAGTCGQRIVAALPLLWAKLVSLHDAGGRIHWHRGEVLGPPEREAMRMALESFVGPGAPSRVNHPLQRDRTAVLLRTGDESHEFLGFVMLVVDDRWLKGNGTSAPDLPVPVVRAVREWGITLASGVQPPAQELSTPCAEIKPTQVVALLQGVEINAATTEQVAAVLRFCHQNGVRVIPRGAGTSLSGGALPMADADKITILLADEDASGELVPARAELCERLMSWGSDGFGTLGAVMAMAQPAD